MKSRSEIKAIAKQNFNNNFWGCVGSVFLIEILICMLASSLLFSGVVIIGLNLFGLTVYKGEYQSIKIELTGRKIGGYLWAGLFEFFWLLLFIVPGIIKAYSYSMTTYILGDCPDVKAKDALKLSMRMMKGHKWQLFVLQLTFIGWDILTILTLGILGVFYVEPYKAITYAGFYDEIKNEAIRTGAVTQDQLDGKVAA